MKAHRQHSFVVTIALAVVALLLPLSATAEERPKSDKELLREAQFAGAREDRHFDYGLRPGHKTLSPTYHITSAGLYVWQNGLAPDVVNPGGYTDTNADYFKSLVTEYGLIGAVVLQCDRLVRNSRIGRQTTPKNSRGLIEDSPKRYRPLERTTDKQKQ